MATVTNTVLSSCFISNNNNNNNRYTLVGPNSVSFTCAKPQIKRAIGIVIRASTEDGVMATEKGGIKIINNPPESKLTELGVRSWPNYARSGVFILAVTSSRDKKRHFGHNLETKDEHANNRGTKWGCPPSKFPWTYSSKETCYLLKGKVKVYPDGSNEAVEIGAGDFVEFPKGMSCTWDVSEEVDKHYKFE